MFSRYEIFCKIIEKGSFTKVAEQLGYSQSAISQTVKALEQELGVRLINRGKEGISLTKDGEVFYPYLHAVGCAEGALHQKHKEVQGLENGTIRIGTFTSVSRNILPQLMKKFKELYPTVHFVLKQGEYTSISKWVQEGSVDFGFVNTEAVKGLTVKTLYQDKMVAILPMQHSLASYPEISLAQLEEEPFILLDEGEHSVPLQAFLKRGISPKIQYKVYDDYTILAMVEQGLGVSIMYRFVLKGFEKGFMIRPIKEELQRTVALAWKNWDTMPLAARHFAKYIIQDTPSLVERLEGGRQV